MSNYYLLSNGEFINKDELYHYGVKGQKWGVRRYQNADGSLTAAGRKRFKQVNSDEKQKARDTETATRLLKEYAEYRKHQSKELKNEAEEFRDLDKDIADDYLKASENAIRDSKVYEKRLKDISNGTLVAGRDFITAYNKSGRLAGVGRYGSKANNGYNRVVDIEDMLVFKRSESEIKDNRTYKKTGIKVTRDDLNRVTGLSAKDATPEQIKKIHQMQRSIAKNGDY